MATVIRPHGVTTASADEDCICLGEKREPQSAARLDINGCSFLPQTLT